MMVDSKRELDLFIDRIVSFRRDLDYRELSPPQIMRHIATEIEHLYKSLSGPGPVTPTGSGTGSTTGTLICPRCIKPVTVTLT